MIEIVSFFATSSSQFNTQEIRFSFFFFLGVNHFLFVCLYFHRLRETHTISPAHSMTFLTEKLCSLISDTTPGTPVVCWFFHLRCGNQSMMFADDASRPVRGGKSHTHHQTITIQTENGVDDEWNFVREKKSRLDICLPIPILLMCLCVIWLVLLGGDCTYIWTDEEGKRKIM